MADASARYIGHTPVRVCVCVCVCVCVHIAIVAECTEKECMCGTQNFTFSSLANVMRPMGSFGKVDLTFSRATDTFIPSAHFTHTHTYKSEGHFTWLGKFDHDPFMNHTFFWCYPHVML